MIFQILGTSITNEDSYTSKLTNLVNEGMYLDNQINPIYGSNPSDWEIIDTSTEIYTRD